MVIFEDELKFKVKEILQKRETERMNQYIFNGKVIEDVFKSLEEDEKEKTENKEQEHDDISLTDYKKLFN